MASALPARTFDTSGKTGARLHDRQLSIRRRADAINRSEGIAVSGRVTLANSAQEFLHRIEKLSRRLKLGHVRATRNDLEFGVRQSRRQLMRHRRRRRLVVLADQDEDRDFHPGKLSAEIESSQRVARGAKHGWIGPQK